MARPSLGFASFGGVELSGWTARGQRVEIDFREAGIADAEAIGALHVAAWRESYATLLPATLLDGLSAGASAAQWRAALADPEGFGRTTILVAESGGRIIGFGACCDQRDPALAEQGFGGEFGAIYVLRNHQRGGVGSALMRLMARSLLDRGRSAASLWVLRDNGPARAFYERLGAAPVAEREAVLSGAVLRESGYGWRDLTCFTDPGRS